VHVEFALRGCTADNSELTARSWIVGTHEVL
jgi:hypothetical protein